MDIEKHLQQRRFNSFIEDYIQKWGEEHKYLATSYVDDPDGESELRSDESLVEIEYLKHNKGISENFKSNLMEKKFIFFF